MISLRNAVKNYLAMRRALGYALRDREHPLGQFVSFMEQEKASTITSDLALRWAKQPCNVHPSWWAKRLSFIRGFARYQSAFDPRTELPPQRLLPGYQRKTPYIYSDEDIRRLLKAARRLPPQGLQRQTYPTVFGLLAVTGLRISEALALQRSDVDLNAGLLTIRLTKFKKSRLVPIHPSTCKALLGYARRRDAVHPETPAFFVSADGRPLTYWTVRSILIQLLCRIGLRKPGDRSGPCLHGLRHRFAIQTLLRWYRSGVDVERRLPMLSTYLGHACVTDTYWYLSAVPELLALTSNRLEKRWEGL